MGNKSQNTAITEIKHSGLNEDAFKHIRGRAHGSLTLDDIFKFSTRRFSQCPALQFEDALLSYDELNTHVNDLANRLKEAGSNRGDRIGIGIARSMETIVAVLAVFRAGGCCVPIDPEYPKSRVEYMLANSGARILLTSPHAGKSSPLITTVTPPVDCKPDVDQSPLAYIIHTSGSTGLPKGVAFPEKALLNLIDWQTAQADFKPLARVLQFASPSFDVFFQELFSTFASGGTLVLVTNETRRDSNLLLDFITRNKIERVFLPYVALKNLAECALSGNKFPSDLREIYTAGEQLIVDRALRTFFVHLPSCLLENQYGPSESHVVTHHRLRGHPESWPTTPPIGKPIQNCAIRIIGDHGDSAPEGEIGELFLSGTCLANGYVNNESLTKEKFVNIDTTGGITAPMRFYRTGDLARRSPEGDIEFLGRIDHQVKIRGFRVEPGEIEARLNEHASVHTSVVVDREDQPGEKRLVAFLISNNSGQENSVSLRKHLLEALPEYMVPSQFFHLEKLPLTPSGKVDRKALKERNLQNRSSTESDPADPIPPIESKMLEWWRTFLGNSSIQPEDTFLESGGHSLIAMRLTSHICDNLGVVLTVSEFLSNPSVKELALKLENKVGYKSSETPKALLPPIVARRNGSRTLPLSNEQRHILMDALRARDAPIYNEPYTIRLEGTEDIEKLRRALNAVVQRHEILKTTYHFEGGELWQEVQESIAPTLEVLDLRGTPEENREAIAVKKAGEDCARLFDLTQDPPIRALLVILSDDDWRLNLTLHHIADDGITGLTIVANDLRNCYEALENGNLNAVSIPHLQYGDYALWQREHLGSEPAAPDLDYWRQKLAGSIPTELPGDRPRPSSPAHRGALERFELPAELWQAVQLHSKQLGTSTFCYLLTAFNILLNRIIRENDLVFGTVASARNQPGSESIAGCFLNYLVLRTDMGGNPDFAKALKRTQKTLYEAMAHANIPLSGLVEHLPLKRSSDRRPLYQIMFSMEPRRPSAGGPWKISQFEFHSGASKLDLTFALDETDEGIIGRVEYDSDLFRPGTIQRLIQQFSSLLQSILHTPESPIAFLSLMTDSERENVLHRFNDTSRIMDESLRLHDFLGKHANLAPDKIAVEFGPKSFTYGELAKHSDSLAILLQETGVEPDDRVAVLARRSEWLPVALFGVLKAGGAYVPLDPGQPSSRINFMIRDCGAKVLLLGKDVETPDGIGLPVYKIENATQNHSGISPKDPARPHNLAYVIYTSGSTGQPKGALIEHRSIVNRLAWMASQYRFSKQHVQLQKTPTTFDVSVHELFLWSFIGARLALSAPGAERNPATLIDEIKTHGVTHIHFVPSMLSAFLSHLKAFGGIEDLASIQEVFCSGEALPGHTVMEFQKLVGSKTGANLHNLYGPTEAAVDVTYFDCSQYQGTASVPIGKPVWNTRMYILDENMNPVPIGAVGELYIGGFQVGRGYLNRPELSRERFIKDPFSADSANRLYRTGDLARWLPDGNIEYLGRTDFQIKIRGIRVEPGEIEEAIVKFPGISEAVVIPDEDESGETRLIGYVTKTHGTSKLDTTSTLLSLKQNLPDHLVPSILIELEKFPVTGSGKLDRKALPKPGFLPVEDSNPSFTSANPAEDIAASIWHEFLPRARLDGHDGFFEAGGNSLLAIRLLARVRTALGIPVNLARFFERPTFPGLLDLINKPAGDTLAINQPQPRSTKSDCPLSSGQKRMWFLNAIDQSGVGFNIVFPVRITGDLRVDALCGAIRDTVKKHESLRTVFPAYDGNPVQSARVSEEMDLVAGESRHSSDPDADLASILKSEWNYRFDLEKGPLFRARLIAFAKNDHLLVLTLHHILADETAESILYEDIAGHYNQRVNQFGLVPKPPFLQAADIAVWEKEFLQSPVVDTMKSWWKDYLRDAPVILDLPLDFKRPGALSFAGKRVSSTISRPVSEAFTKLVRSQDATPFIGFMSAWALFVGKLCGVQEVVIGAPVSLRGAQGSERTIAFLINSLPFRLSWNPDLSFEDLIACFRPNAISVYQHASLPFEKIVDLLELARFKDRLPLFQVMLTMQGVYAEAPHLEDLRTEVIRSRPDTSKFDLTLAVAESDDQYHLELEFRTDLFEQATVTAWLNDFIFYLGKLVEYASEPIAGIPCLPEAERAKQLVWSTGEVLPLPRDKTLGGLIEEVSTNVSETTAVAGSSGRLTYAQLVEYGSSWAGYLADLKIEKETPVGVCFERSQGWVVAMLAVMKAGGIYVPLDTSWPEERFRWILKDAAIPVVLAGAGAATDTLRSAIEGQPGLNEIQIIEMDSGNPQRNPAADGLEFSCSQADSTAYLIYTSGSTGKPKGVPITHANAVASTLARNAYYGESPKRFLLLSPAIFDSSIAGIFWTLCSGGALVLPPPGAERDPQVLAEWILKERITHFLCLPSILRILLEFLRGRPHCLETVIVAGESCPSGLPEFFRRSMPGVRLFNEYGPTEGTVWCSAEDITHWQDGTSVPIGSPIPNTQLFVVDKSLQLLPRGANGEIVLAGAGLARGYLNQSSLTEERFIEPAGNELPASRIYRTGDIGRWNRDGKLEFMGRADNQVKIRGFRIETGEIESCLEAHDSIEQAVVIARNIPSSTSSGQPVTPDSLDLEFMLHDAPESLVKEELDFVLGLSDREIEEELAKYYPDKSAASYLPDKVVRRRYFHLELHTKRKGFINPPREVQRNWALGQAMEEIADDLEHLHEISADFVAGSGHKIEHQFEDITQAELSDSDIMEDWQTPVMQSMAEYVTESHGDILEIGFGRGVSSEMIQALGVRSHTIVEVNKHVVETHFNPWRKKHAERDIHLCLGLWQEVEPQLGLYDGIFFHSFPLNEKEFEDYVLKSVTFAEHAFPAMARHLKEGGVFTYLTLEIDSLSRRHQRSLLKHFSSITTKVISVNVPEDSHDIWWAKSMVIIKAVK